MYHVTTPEIKAAPMTPPMIPPAIAPWFGLVCDATDEPDCDAVGKEVEGKPDCDAVSGKVEDRPERFAVDDTVGWAVPVVSGLSEQH